jgi:L-alanine-DL-glutamate epimerase-like enolase superfamily enzyme
MIETVQSIRVRSIEVPLETPVWLGGTSVTKRDYAFVEVITNEGREGHALAFARGGDLTSAIIRNVCPLVVGKDPDQIEAIWEAIYLKNRLNGQQGLLMRALSIMDLALWDLKAKKANMPLYSLLGGFRESTPVLMAGGYYMPNKDIRQLCEEFVGYVDQGYKHLKLMVGGATMEEDLHRVIQVKKSLPAEVSLAVDANGTWNDAKAVLRWIEKAEREGGEISFVEEPLSIENLDGASWLCERTTVPIASGEFVAGRWAFKELIYRKCMDIIRSDATLCGGMTEWRRICSMASAWNLQLFPHYFASIHLHAALAFPNVKMIEVVSPKGRNSSLELLIGKSYDLRDGIAYPNRLPGLGLTIDEEFMRAYTLQTMTVEGC